MFGRKRRDPDAEPRMSLSPEQRQRAHEHAMVKLRAAKAQYIAGRLSFEDLFEHWWSADLCRRPAFSMKSALREIAIDAMEIEKARLLPQKPRFATGGVIPPGRAVPLERRGTDCVIPRAEVERLAKVRSAHTKES